MSDLPLLTPDRPGRYLLRDGKTSVTVLVVFGKFAADTIPTGNLWINGAVPSNRWWDIIARAPDDAEWCLAQATALCPPGYWIKKLTEAKDMSPAICRTMAHFWNKMADAIEKDRS